MSKFCIDAGFLNVVEIGRYFMTEDNGEQFSALACDESSQPKGWIQGKHENWTRIGNYDQLFVS